MVMQLLSVRQLAKRLCMAESTVWLRVRRGELPPVTHRFGPRCSRWDWAVVQAFLDRAATNSAEHPEAL
jgi:predicted DNA-binding transcriptional regulator AlpA